MGTSLADIRIGTRGRARACLPRQRTSSVWGLSAATAVAVLLAASPALAASGTTTDSSENQRPPELTFTRPMERSDYDTAMQMIKHKQYAEAIPHLQFALADKPQDVDILTYLGLAKRMVGDYEGALYYYQRALAIAPNSKGLHESMGEFDLQINDVASAQKELATLATLCSSGCEERDALTKAIADYKPVASPVAGAATPVSMASPKP